MVYILLLYTKDLVTKDLEAAQEATIKKSMPKQLVDKLLGQFNPYLAFFPP